MKDYLGENLKILNRTFNFKVVWTFLVDLVFHALTVFTTIFLLGQISEFYSKVENVVGNVSTFDVNNATMVKSMLQALIWRSILYSVLIICLLFLFYVLFKVIIYCIISNKNISLDILKKYAAYSGKWFVIIIAPLLFLLMLIAVSSQLGLVEIGLFTSVFGIIIVSYLVMVANIIYFRRNEGAIKHTFQTAFNLRKYGFSIIIFLIGVFIFNSLWGFAVSYFSEDTFFTILWIIFLLLTSWFRYYLWIIEKRNKK